MSTIKDVAHAAGVSISTVSIVLNGLAEARKIPKRTQDKVLEAVHAVNYQPNLSARRLRSSENQEYTIAIYWANDTRIFVLTRIIQALQGMILRSSPKINLEIRPFVPGHLENDVALRTLSSFNGVLIGTLNKQDLDYLECRDARNISPASPSIISQLASWQRSNCSTKASERSVPSRRDQVSSRWECGAAALWRHVLLAESPVSKKTRSSSRTRLLAVMRPAKSSFAAAKFLGGYFARTTLWG